MIDGQTSESPALREFLTEKAAEFAHFMKEFFNEAAALRIDQATKVIDRARTYTQDFDKTVELQASSADVKNWVEDLLWFYHDILEVQSHYRRDGLTEQAKQLDTLIDQFIKAFAFFDSQKKE